MFKEKPIISNQYGALVMALIPFLYGIFASQWTLEHLWFGLSWLFLYLFSYPFLGLFSKKEKIKYKKWAMIYFVISLICALPILFSSISLLQFLLPILPLAGINIYYAKKHDERNIINDIVAILIFGIVGMASFYLATEKYHIEILLHPCLFFITSTFYVKSVARERKNPTYLWVSISSHIILVVVYALLASYPLVLAYLIALLRAAIVPHLHWKIKYIGMLELLISAILLIALILTK